MKRQIIAIGGGGFSTYSEYTPGSLLLEKYFLQQTGKECPSICFIPTASGESLNYIVNFYAAFGKLNCKVSHLSLFQLPTKDLRGFLLKQDAIYVGGGNTKSMLALWREWHLDEILKDAWHQGIVLGGVSAGSNCWFEESVTDSIPGPLTALKGLGFLKGSTCPHYDGEKMRRPSYHSLIAQGQILPGLAIEDGVLAHFIEDKLVAVLRNNLMGCAYNVSKVGSEIKEERIEATSLSKSA